MGAPTVGSPSQSGWTGKLLGSLMGAQFGAANIAAIAGSTQPPAQPQEKGQHPEGQDPPVGSPRLVRLAPRMIRCTSNSPTPPRYPGRGVRRRPQYRSLPVLERRAPADPRRHPHLPSRADPHRAAGKHPGHQPRIRRSASHHSAIGLSTGHRGVWKSPESVEACTMRERHVRETQEVRPGVPGGGGADCPRYR